LFKNKRNQLKKENLLVLISSRIVEPEKAHLDKFTQLHVAEYQHVVDDMYDVVNQRDPVYRAFFDRSRDKEIEPVDQFMFNRHKQDALQAAGARRNNNDSTDSADITLRGPSVVSQAMSVENIPGGCSLCQGTCTNKRHRSGRNSRRQRMTKKPGVTVAQANPVHTKGADIPVQQTGLKKSLGDMVQVTQKGVA
jgi:hypothetical protein